MDQELFRALRSLQGRADLSLDELLDLATRFVPRVATGQARYKVTEVPSERTVRYYTTSGLIDRPLGLAGTRAVYGYRHILQILVVKSLQARDLPLRKIRGMVAGRPDDYLEAILGRTESDRWESVHLGPGVELRIRGGELPPGDREKVVEAAEGAVGKIVGARSPSAAYNPGSPSAPGARPGQL